jgi:murein DD-endopeptidase MepM/ murein hydrolase activator NlpD
MKGFLPTTAIVLLGLLLIQSSLGFGAVYRYQDTHGKWHYSDKKPSKSNTKKIDTLEFKDHRKLALKPEISYHHKNGKLFIYATNSLFAPVEFDIRSPLFEGGKLSVEVEPNSKKNVYSATENSGIRPDYNFSFAMGSPEAQHQHDYYLPPVPSNQSFRISQSFKGRFSHYREPHIYSVDIAMPVGTTLHAARGGIVSSTKDDYHMGGAKEYFLDKANFVKILHDDGTIATYAHILLGSLKVKLGDKIATGQAIARSGSSGYSTGPHLHFVIQRNTGMAYKSVPFKFRQAGMAAYTPKRHMEVSGQPHAIGIE